MVKQCLINKSCNLEKDFVRLDIGLYTRSH